MYSNISKPKTNKITTGYTSMFDRLERKEQEELDKVGGYDAVNARSKKNLSNKLGNKFGRNKVLNRDKREDRKELNIISKMDRVNPQSKASLASKLGNKFGGKKVMNRDKKEDRKELKAIGKMDRVNPNSKANLSNKLGKMGSKMNNQAFRNREKREDRKELKKVAKMDKVNSSSQAKVSSLMAKKLGKGGPSVSAGRLNHASCRKAFDNYKTVGDEGDYLTEPAYKKACRDLSVPIDTFGFSRLDKNKSGTIDFGEFLKVLLHAKK